MKLNKETNQQYFINELINRVKDIEQRERIVIKMPFSCAINRVELYCSETPTNTSGVGEMISGEAFNGIVSVSVFTDYSNKHANKQTYTYKKELLNYLPILVQKLTTKF